MIADLSRFEIGYDRAYIGAALHCLDCIAAGTLDEHEELHEITDAPLADVVAFALAHQAEHHQR